MNGGKMKNANAIHGEADNNPELYIANRALFPSIKRIRRLARMADSLPKNLMICCLKCTVTGTRPVLEKVFKE
jgi:hypothetical protein